MAFKKKFLKKSPFKSVVGAGLSHLSKCAFGYAALPMVASLYGQTLMDPGGSPVGKAVLGGIGAVAVGKGIQALKTPGKSLVRAVSSPIGTVAALHGAYKLGKHLHAKRKLKNVELAQKHGFTGPIKRQKN